MQIFINMACKVAISQTYIETECCPRQSKNLQLHVCTGTVLQKVIQLYVCTITVLQKVIQLYVYTITVLQWKEITERNS